MPQGLREFAKTVRLGYSLTKYRRQRRGELHGFRHGEKLNIKSRDLIADTKSDPDWVIIKTRQGNPIARQAKFETGRRFRRGFGNPDYIGFSAYPLERWDSRGGGWTSYDTNAEKGDLRYNLSRFATTKLVAAIREMAKAPGKVEPGPAFMALAKRTRSNVTDMLEAKIIDGKMHNFADEKIFNSLIAAKSGLWGRAFSMFLEGFATLTLAHHGCRKKEKLQKLATEPTTIKQPVVSRRGTHYYNLLADLDTELRVKTYTKGEYMLMLLDKKKRIPKIPEELKREIEFRLSENNRHNMVEALKDLGYLKEHPI